MPSTMIIETADWGWSRRWQPLSDEHNPKVDVGYQSSVTLTDLRDELVLVLIGDPGSGKSTELAKERKQIEASIGLPNVISIDSKNPIESDSIFTGIWFESGKWKRWLGSTGNIYVFLDGLDEFVYRMPGLEELILQKLEDAFTDHPSASQRIRLRITSRSIGLPANFLSRLKTVFELHSNEDDGESRRHLANISYFLSPLSNLEFREAAESIGVDPDAFERDLDVRGFVPLARRPKLLRMLLRIYLEFGSIPQAYEDVYWQGLKNLIANEHGISDPVKTLRQASRVAFVMVFSQTSRLKFGTDLRNGPRAPLGLNIFLEPRQSDDGAFQPFTTTELNELRTSELFTGQPEHFTWSELPDMEYLAAKYAIQCELPFSQLIGLIQNPLDPRGRVVPELSNVAAHLAGMNEEIFDAIVSHDPTLLVRADSALIDEESRERVVLAMLDAYESGELLKSEWYGRGHFSPLAYEGISDVLKPYILDRGLKRVTREIAIYIARDCNSVEVVLDLSSIATSYSEDEVLRRSAAWALFDIGTLEAKTQLASILSEMPASDELQELKGLSLRAVWPNLWSLEEILPHITPPESPVLGAYRNFLGQEFIQGVTIDDLPRLYGWLSQQPDWKGEMRDLDRITELLIGRAVDALPSKSAAEFIASKIVDSGNLNLFHKSFMDGPILLKPAAESISKRRALVEELVNVAATEVDAWGGAFHGACDLYQLLEGDNQRLDIQWIAEQATAPNVADDIRRVWFRLLRAFENGLDDYWMELTFRLYKDSRYAEYLSDLFIVELGSPQAELQKRRSEVFGAKPDDEDSSPGIDWFRSEFDELSEKLSGNNESLWFYFDQLLRHVRPDVVSDGCFIAVCEDLENWRHIRQEDLSVLISTAEQYLRHHEPVCEQLETGRFYIRDQAAYRAMTLLLQHSSDGLGFLRPKDWQRLGPAVLAMPPKTSGSTPPEFEILLASAIENGFDWKPKLIEMVKVADDGSFYYRPLLQTVLTILPDQELISLTEELISSGSPGRSIHHVAGILGAKLPDLVTSRLISLLRERDLDSEISVSLSRTALDYVTGDKWEDLIDIFDQDAELFKATFLEYAYSERDGSPLASRLNEPEVADLYRRLANAFPPNEDLNPVGVHTVTARESMGQLRESLLDHLVARGTWEAAQELRLLMEHLPGIEWLPTKIAQAEGQARQQTWIPHRVEDLLLFWPDSNARIVRSDAQLQAVILESLERLNAELQSESPSVHDLWTHRRPKTTEPKYEEDLSDYIKRHLDKELMDIPIFANREVNNRPGERNDIYIQSVDEQSGTSLKVVCEVKGCWNPGTLTNMRTQLVEQYMKTTQTSFGIYVVGYFDCDAWPVRGKRGHSAASHTIEGLRTDLMEQSRLIEKSGITVVPIVLDCRFP